MLNKLMVAQIIKEAQEAGVDAAEASKILKEMKSGPEAKFVQVFCSLKAIATLHQHAHWNVKGENFYEDHLLFERLYLNASRELDAFAEKFVGLLQIPLPAVLTSKKIAECLEGWSSADGQTKGEILLKEGLAAEKDVIALLKELSDELESSPFKTLGFDDLIGGIASVHEESLYLLQQRLSSRS